MPGGRLTHDDRRQVATWLADGLGYAEIARRLGRPTSTISREVARNGGPGHYQAERAQQATGRRASRRPTRTTSPAGATGFTSATGATGVTGVTGVSGLAAGRSQAELVHGFAEQFATLLAGTGLPRMGARIFAHLLTAASGSLTSADLVHHLKVSPASVSKSIAYLEAMDLVVRHPDPGSRRERYGIVDDVWLRAWRTDTSAHAAVAAAAERGAELLGPATPAGTRLLQMGRFFSWLSDQMHGSTLTAATASEAPTMATASEALTVTTTADAPTVTTAADAPTVTTAADAPTVIIASDAPTVIIAADALTVLAALGYAAGPHTVDELATALGWPRSRVTDAVHAVERQPTVADPLALVSTARETYEVTPRPDRLSPAQRAAIRAHRTAGSDEPPTTATNPSRRGQ